MKVVYAILTFNILICLPVAVLGTTVKLINVDYGTPGDPFEGAIVPGEKGEIYFTLKNSYPLALTDLKLKARPGRCIKETIGELNKSQVAPEEEFRVGPLEIEVKETCKQDEPAALLLVGSYQNSLGKAQTTWVEVPFWIEPQRMLTFSRTNIGATITKDQILEIPFSTQGPRFPIKDISIELDISYQAKHNLIIQLVHMPSNTSIVLHNREYIRNDVLSYGKDGKAITRLQNIVGNPSNGDWKITIFNNTRWGNTTGKLNRITLKLYP